MKSSSGSGSAAELRTGSLGRWRKPPSSSPLSPRKSSSGSAAVVLTATTPSYQDLLLADSRTFGDSYMEQVEAWPRSRYNLLALIQAKLEPILESKGRVIDTLDEVFYNVRPVGKASEFGLVYTGCIKSNSATSHPGCWSVLLGGSVDGGAHKYPIYLIIKTLKPLAYEGDTVKFLHTYRHPVLEPAYAGFYKDDDYTTLFNKNPIREILLGRLLNRLVQRNITPHLPMIYETFTVENSENPKPETHDLSGFAMETCHADFQDFVADLVDRLDDSAQRRRLLTIAVLQLTHALLASQKHYDFRHNDLHAGNAMMTHITKGQYTYRFSADDEDARAAFYSIPNAGMCWKLIDFGNGTSVVFGQEDTISQLALRSGVLAGLRPLMKGGKVARRGQFDVRDHAAEMYDLLRLLSYSTDKLKARAVATAALLDTTAFFDALIELIHEITQESPQRKTLAKILTGKNDAALAGSSGLLQKFFKRVARPFRISSLSAAESVVFDADAHPFNANEALTGPEERYYTVNSDGELVVRSL